MGAVLPYSNAKKNRVKIVSLIHKKEYFLIGLATKLNIIYFFQCISEYRFYPINASVAVWQRMSQNIRLRLHRTIPYTIIAYSGDRAYVLLCSSLHRTILYGYRV